MEGTKFDFTLVSPSQMKNVIMKIKSNSVGVVQISAHFLNLILLHILVYVTNIFNISINHEIFPSIWKLAFA